MWDCVVAVNTCRGFVGLLGALSIVAGAIKIDRDYDNHGIYATLSGSALFFGGWTLFACSIGLLSNDLSGLTINLRALLGLIGSFFVATAITLSQVAMYQKNLRAMRLYFVFFVLSWPLLAYAIALPSSATVAVNPLIKLALVLIGVTSIVQGKFIQMRYRKRGVDFMLTGTVAPGDTYSPGLAFYTAGWLFLAFANALL